MQLHPVAGGDDLRHQGWTALHLLAGEEEGRERVRLAEDLQNGRGAAGVRPVIEGDRDAFAVVAPRLDPQRVADAGHHRGKAGPGVGEGGD